MVYLFSMQMKLADWENKREDKRRRILMEEAEMRQHGNVWSSVSKQRNKLVEKWMFR